jgi:hypothetical protein
MSHSVTFAGDVCATDRRDEGSEAALTADDVFRFRDFAIRMTSHANATTDDREAIRIHDAPRGVKEAEDTCCV